MSIKKKTPIKRWEKVHESLEDDKPDHMLVRVLQVLIMISSFLWLSPWFLTQPPIHSQKATHLSPRKAQSIIGEEMRKGKKEKNDPTRPNYPDPIKPTEKSEREKRNEKEKEMVANTNQQTHILFMLANLISDVT